MLREPERHGQNGVDQSEEGAGHRRDQNAAPQACAEPDRHPAGHGTGGEDAFDAEVEDTGAFANKRSDDAEDQRGRDAERGRPEVGGDENVEDLGHSAASGFAWLPTKRILKRRNRPETRTHNSAMATIRSAR